MDDDLGLDNGRQDLITLVDGRLMSTHGPEVCFGPHCCIHKPSDHPLRNAPLTWVGDLKMMFRVCEHKSIHPDPDALEYHQVAALIGRVPPYDGYHPCCEHHCCNEAFDDE
jgi:hypothetical protein